jgi:nucleosome binding factor SPN SPT16 subunit
MNPTNKPVNQITINSYLGRALEEVHECSATQDAPVPSGDSSSLSLSSSSDSKSESEEHKRQHRSKRQNHQKSCAKKVNECQKRHGQSSSFESLRIKPKPSKDYDGTANAHSFEVFTLPHLS